MVQEVRALTIRVTEKQYAYLQQQAEDKYSSKSTIVRQILKEVMKNVR